MADLDVPEHWRLLELAGRTDLVSGEDGAEVDPVLAGVDWDLAVLAAIKHRLTPRLADFLIRSERMSLVPKQLRRTLVQALQDNRHKAALATREAGRVVAALAERDVVVACTKGITFQSTLYDGFGGRSFEDIDLMIHEESKDRAAEVLLELGYLANMTVDFSANRVVPLPRRDVAMYRMYPDHLPHFLRPVAGLALPYFVVDVCFNITWFGASWQVPMREVLARVDHVRASAFDDVVELPALTAPYDFVFTVMHLFREGWFERTAVSSPLRLGHFADVWRRWHRLTPAEVAALTELVGKHEIGPPIAWVCHHLDEMFGSSVVTCLGLDDLCDDAWLHSAGGVNGGNLAWSGDMRARIMLGAPPRLVAAPEPRFAADARVGGR